jgi:hypothetical protein
MSAGSLGNSVVGLITEIPDEPVCRAICPVNERGFQGLWILFLPEMAPLNYR